jgi:Holliday junction resolvasome RuvABC endonuclease subunit
MSLIHNTKITQNVLVSTLNSTAANINAGITWLGTGEESLDTTAIQTIFKADKNCTLYLDQGTAIGTWQITDSWDVPANIGDARTVLSAAPYFRIRIKNTELTNTTSLNLLTGLIPVLSVLPRALKKQGGLSTTTNQEVVDDLNNSSTAILGSSGIFTGVATTTLGVAGIQVSLKTDQNCTVYVEQSPDGSNWDIVDSFHYYWALGGSGWTTQAVSSYVRVRVVNLSTVSATSYFRLQTSLCPIVEAVPRVLTQHGNFKTAVNEIVGEFDTSVGITPMGQIRVTESVRLAGSGFSGTVFDTNFWVKTSQVGTGDATVTGGQMILATGTTLNSSIVVNTLKIARYIAASSNFYRGIVRAPSVTGVNTRRWGAFDANDGYFFEHDGATLSLVCRKSGSDANKIVSGSFNGHYGSTFELDTNAHTCEIYWSNRTAYFVIDNELIHTFRGLISQLVSTQHLKVGYQCTNASGNTANNTLEVRSGTISRLGKEATSAIWKYVHGALAATILKTGPGKLQRVVINAGTNNTEVRLYDALTATNPIAIIIPNSNFSGSLEYNIDFYIGLTLVTIDAANDVTIVYE